MGFSFSGSFKGMRPFLSMALVALSLGGGTFIPTLSHGADMTYRPVAVVNDVPITGYDLEQRIRLMGVLLGLNLTPTQKQEMAGEALQGLVDEQLQRSAAGELGLVVSPEQRKGFKDRLMAQTRMGEGPFQRTLKENGIDETAFDTFAESQARWNALIVEQFARKITISEGDILKIASRFSETGQMKARLSEIFIPIDNGGDEVKAENKMKQAMAALQGKEPFGNVASRLSESPSRSQKGELGWVSLAQIDPVLASEIAQKPAGAIVGPLRSERGVHLLYVHEKQNGVAGKAGNVNLDGETRQKIEDQLFQEELALQARRYLQNLRSKASLTMYE